jgi:hypothetical protein
MTAWIPVLIAALPMIQTGVTEFIAWLNTLVAAAKQSGEWTPEEDAAYRAALFAKTNDPAYKSDAT